MPEGSTPCLDNYKDHRNKDDDKSRKNGNRSKARTHIMPNLTSTSSRPNNLIVLEINSALASIAVSTNSKDYLPQVLQHL